MVPKSSIHANAINHEKPKCNFRFTWLQGLKPSKSKITVSIYLIGLIRNGVKKQENTSRPQLEMLLLQLNRHATRPD